jgi:hypothetical protein
MSGVSHSLLQSTPVLLTKALSQRQLSILKLHPQQQAQAGEDVARLNHCKAAKFTPQWARDLCEITLRNNTDNA